MDNKYKGFINALILVGSGSAIAAAIFAFASSGSDELTKETDENLKKKETLEKKWSGGERVVSLDSPELLIKKSGDTRGINSAYSFKPSHVKLSDGVDIYLSTDNNHKPCYMAGKDFLSKNGKKVPFNFVPDGMRCDTMDVVEKNGVAAVKVNSLSWFKNTANYPKQFAMYINGEGLNGVVFNCGDFWSNNCENPTKSTIIIADKTPAELPTPRSIESAMLTTKVPVSFINGSKHKWPKNQDFYYWKRVPFKSALAVNGVVDGDYIQTMEEAYKKGVDVAIVLNPGVVVMKHNQPDGSFCYIDGEGFPINKSGTKLNFTKFPPSMNCKNATEDNGKMVVTDLVDLVKWSDAPKEYKVITNGIYKNKKTVLENCGQYWSDNCKAPQYESVVLGKDRKSIPPQKSKNRDAFTTEIGKDKTNLNGGVIASNGLWKWENVNIQTSINGLADLIVCDDNVGCYDDKVAIASRYAMTPQKRIVQYKTNEFGVGLWLSVDGNYILAPTNSDSWSSIKNQSNIKGVSKNGKFYWSFVEKKNVDDAIKECSLLGMELPNIDDTNIVNRAGIQVKTWTWTGVQVDNDEYSTWKNGTLGRDLSANKNNVICVSRERF